MQKGRTGVNTQTFNNKVHTNTKYILCRVCGKNIAKNIMAIRTHNRHCKGNVKEEKIERKLKCIKVFNINSSIHIFYYKGKVYCLTTILLAKMANTTSNIVQRSLGNGSSYTEIIEHKRIYKECIKGNTKKLPDGTIEKQKLLMNAFKPKRK